jgi:hypothetical protein
MTVGMPTNLDAKPPIVVRIFLMCCPPQMAGIYAFFLSAPVRNQFLSFWRGPVSKHASKAVNAVANAFIIRPSVSVVSNAVGPDNAVICVSQKRILNKRKSRAVWLAFDNVRRPIFLASSVVRVAHASRPHALFAAIYRTNPCFAGNAPNAIVAHAKPVAVDFRFSAIFSNTCHVFCV